MLTTVTQTYSVPWGSLGGASSAVVIVSIIYKVGIEPQAIETITSSTHVNSYGACCTSCIKASESQVVTEVIRYGNSKGVCISGSTG